jgi:hypothetical protein
VLLMGGEPSKGDPRGHTGHQCVAELRLALRAVSAAVAP